MTQLTKLLELRKEIKERKPEFIRQDNPKRMKVNDKWRKPKGIHSKIRHKFKGRRKMPSRGYKSPYDVRGLHISGIKVLNLDVDSHIAKIEQILKSKPSNKKPKAEIKKESSDKKHEKHDAKPTQEDKKEHTELTEEERKESEKKEKDKVL